jgi:SnoaL-like domain
MTDTPLKAVHAYLDAFNAGDQVAMSAAFAADGSILDGMAPHLWLGPTAAADWYRDVLTEGAHLGASGYRVTSASRCTTTPRATPRTWWSRPR